MSTTAVQALNSVGASGEILKLDQPAQYTSIIIYDPLEEKKLAQFANSVAKVHKEEVLAKVGVKELQKDESWILVLTNKALYKFSPDAPLNQPRKRKWLTEYFDVGIDSSNPKQLTTLVWKDSLKTSVKASFKKIVAKAGADLDLSSILQKREYICSSQLQRDQFVWLFNRVLQRSWQTFLETTVVPSPEIYQQHHMVIKHNKRGANQERFLVVSNTFIYNIELSHSSEKQEVDLKWTVPIECISAVALDDACRLDFFFDKDELEQYISHTKKSGGKIRKDLLDKGKLNDTYQFSFFDDHARASFVAVVRHLFEKIAKEKQKLTSELKVLVNGQSRYAPVSVRSSLYDVQAGSSIGHSSDSLGRQTMAQQNNNNNTAALQRKGSTLQILLEQHKQQQSAQEHTAILSDPLEKITHGNAEKAHIKHFALYPDLTIKWGDTATKFKYNAKVIGVMKANDILEQLPVEKRPNFFALRTTEKPLYLLATDASSAATWRSCVDAYSGATLNAQANATAPSGETPSGVAPVGGNNQQEFELLKMQLTVPVIKGYLTKFVRGGKGEHERYFSLLPDGTINWGDSAAKLKYSAVVVDVDQDISTFSQTDLPHSRAVRFIRLKTTDKTLELLCPTQESADHWVAVTNKVLNPDYEDDQDDVDQ